MSLPFLFVSAVALVDKQGRVLLAQRPAGKDLAGLWEFPGGKLEDNETPEAALVREMQEELALMIQERDLIPLTFASQRTEKFHLFMPLFACHIWAGEPHPMEGQCVAWVSPQTLIEYPMPQADAPLVQFIRTYMDSR